MTDGERSLVMAEGLILLGSLQRLQPYTRGPKEFVLGVVKTNKGLPSQTTEPKARAPDGRGDREGRKDLWGERKGNNRTKKERS